MERAILSINEDLEGHFDFQLQPDFLWYNSLNSLHHSAGKLTNETTKVMTGNSLCLIRSADDLTLLRYLSPNRYRFMGFWRIVNDVSFEASRRGENIARAEVDII